MWWGRIKSEQVDINSITRIDFQNLRYLLSIGWVLSVCSGLINAFTRHTRIFVTFEGAEKISLTQRDYKKKIDNNESNFYKIYNIKY